MANPNDAVGTNGAFGGRTSVNAFNDVLGTFAGRGILSGWVCAPSSGLTVSLGGDGSTRDVAIAEDAAGNKTTINNISQSPVAVTINAAPASNSRIDAIVAYIEDAPNGSGITDNPDVVNVLVVSGTVASNPVAPNDGAIRAAITADGASGSTAYYVVLATVRISTGTTDIDTTMISQGERAVLRNTAISEGAIGTEQIENGAVTSGKLDFTTFPNAITVNASADPLTTTSQSRIKVGEIVATGLNPNWQYLATITYGLFCINGGQAGVVGFSDVTTQDGTYLIPPDGMRCSAYQASMQFTTLLTPSATSMTFNINGRQASTTGTWSAERVKMTLVPIRPISQ